MSSIASSHAETQVYMIVKKSIGRSPFKTDNRSLDNWVNNTNGVGFLSLYHVLQDKIQPFSKI